MQVASWRFVKRSRSFLIPLAAFAMALSLAPAPTVSAQESGGKDGATSGPAVQQPPSAAYEWWKEVLAPSNRGLAIASPVDRPDGYEPSVGGKTRFVPYYSSYGLRYWSGVSPNRTGTAAPQKTPAGAGPSSQINKNYGSYTGANKDEDYLLHLGGFGPGSPEHGAGAASMSEHGPRADIIDRMDEKEGGAYKFAPSTGSTLDHRGVSDATE